MMHTPAHLGLALEVCKLPGRIEPAATVGAISLYQVSFRYVMC